MGRFPQPHDGRGSLRWIQRLVNEFPHVLQQGIGVGPITWYSPRSDDQWSEYRDQAFLDRLGLTLPQRPLADFWPANGPQWDALGRATAGNVILVEAKAHVPEILSTPSQATPDNLEKIRASLHETATALGAIPGTDWTLRFYQYANRLAHAHLLQDLNGIGTRLVFLYLIGDQDMHGPQSRREWEAAIMVLKEALGLRGRVPNYVKDVFIEVTSATPTVV
jgi:hypothetical protein